MPLDRPTSLPSGIHRLYAFAALGVIAWLGAAPAARAELEALSPAEPGPYAWVQDEIVAADPLGRRSVRSVRIRPAGVDGEVPAGVRFPLLVFSHGNRVFPELYLDLFQHLASHGYIVVAPRHEGSQLGDAIPARSTESAVERPGEVSLVLDDLLARDADPQSPLAGLVDTRRIGIGGQSFGGYTVLAARGGRIDLEATDAGLASIGSESIERYCERVGWAAGSLSCGRILAAIDTGMRVDLSDPRFSVGLLITPALFVAFGTPGIAEVRPTNLVLAGELDAQVSFGEEILPLYAALPPTKYLVNLRRAGHVSNTALCGTPFDQAALADCPALLTHTRTYVTAFLGRHLKGIEAYAPFLTPEYAAGLVEVDFASEEARAPLPLSIDIRPATPGDSVSPRPDALLRVALLGSKDVEARDIDPTSVAFGPGAARALRSRRVDVDRDGRRDLVSTFRLGDTGLPLGRSEACVEALVDGRPARGCAELWVGRRRCEDGHEVGWLAAARCRGNGL